jgi:hypothetical protein
MQHKRAAHTLGLILNRDNTRERDTNAITRSNIKAMSEFMNSDQHLAGL